MLQLSTGFWLAAGGMYKKLMPFSGVRFEVRMFLPKTTGRPQHEGLSGGTLWVLFTTIASSDHLWVCLPSSFRPSSKSQGLQGLHIRPAAKSSHRC